VRFLQVNLGHFILEIAISPKYSGTQIIAGDSHSNRLTSEDTEYNLSVYQVSTSTLTPLNSTRGLHSHILFIHYTWHTDIMHMHAYVYDDITYTSLYYISLPHCTHIFYLYISHGTHVFRISMYTYIIISYIRHHTISLSHIIYTS